MSLHAAVEGLRFVFRSPLIRSTMLLDFFATFFSSATPARPDDGREHGCSWGGPQLGELEAGALANWLGATISVVSGGIGCLVATAWVALTTPAVLHYRSSAPSAVRFGTPVVDGAPPMPSAVENPRP